MERKQTPGEAFANRLKEYRLKRKITQAQMAENLQIPRATYNYYENGKSVPDINLLALVASYTGYSMEYILGQSEYKTYQHEVNAREAIESAGDPGEEAMLKILQTAKNLRMRYDIEGQPVLDRYLIPLANICAQIDNIQKYVPKYIEQPDGSFIPEVFADYDDQFQAAYKACNVLLERGFS